ncbi:MAG: APC family permease [Nitrososphaerales archaeon]|jgi:amino acid transporter
MARVGGDERGRSLGPILCWAVVFADIGTSVYYVPGILYGNVGSLAGFFVFMTTSVFVLLALKYAEVTRRFPQGGGVVTVGAQAMNHWVGALGGMFILVDYFLTAAISSLSGILYLSVVFPVIGPYALPVTVAALVLLGVLNVVGVGASAKVSLVGASVAFVSDLALLFTVFTHLSVAQFLALFPRMFEGHSLAPTTVLIGFAGSFLAFSGLESISQLSPVMKTPRRRVSGIALALVVITVGLTSPLLTMFSTLLLPQSVVGDPVLSSQLVSLLGGRSGGIALQTEIAISASALLVFASNTAIIGTYYVFMALSRMRFFPAIILRRNGRRGTPHYAIILAATFPIVPLVLVDGRVNLLGDMYAFGLLAAFTLTCLGLDIVRHRERKAALAARRLAGPSDEPPESEAELEAERDEAEAAGAPARLSDPSDGPSLAVDRLREETPSPSPYPGETMLGFWHTFKFYIGLLTTVLVFIAWTTNLVAKPLATAFGGTVVLVGMGIAYFGYSRHSRAEQTPVVVTHGEEYLPGSTLAVLEPGSGLNDATVRSAIKGASGKTVVFLYLGAVPQGRTPSLFEFHDPYYEDEEAKQTFGRAERLAREFGVKRLFLYRQSGPGAIARVWRIVHPYDTLVAAEYPSRGQGIYPDRIRYEDVPEGKIAHLLKRW